MNLRLMGWLRSEGVSGDLFMPENHPDSRMRPEWLSTEFADGYPDWLHTYHRRFYHQFTPPKAVARAAQGADVVLTSGREIVSALTLGPPVVFKPSGLDLTDFPFDSRRGNELFSYLYRRRIKDVAKIVTAQEDCFYAAQFLGVKAAMVRHPLPLDVFRLREEVDEGFQRSLREELEPYDLLIVHPSRKNLDSGTTDYKGGEKFLAALEEFCDEDTGLSIKVVAGLHGQHAHRYRELVEACGLQDMFTFVDHLPVPKLHAMMSLPRAVVFDQFGRVARYSLGGVSKEALALGVPLVTATLPDTPEFCEAFGPGCPLRSALTTEEITHRISEIASMSDKEFRRWGSLSARWSEDHLHWENRIHEFMEILEDAAYHR